MLTGSGGRDVGVWGAVIPPPSQDAGTCDVQVDQPRQSAALTTPRGDSLSLRLASVKPRQASVSTLPEDSGTAVSPLNAF